MRDQVKTGHRHGGLDMGTQGTPPAADTITAVHGFLSSHLRAAYHTPPLELDTRAAIAVMRQRVCTMKCDPAGISVEDYAVILNAFFDEGNVLPLLGSGSVSFRLCCNRQSAAGSGVGVVGGEFQHGDSGFVLTVSEVEPSPSSFADLALFAEHRGRQAPGTRQPRRHPGTEAQYDLYKAWCLQQGVDNHAYVVKYTPWDGRAFCLTPCLVPYHTEAGVSHWILWHDPASVPGDTELDPVDQHSKVCTLLGDAAPRPDEVIIYQNQPESRSIPTIAHAHCFFRPQDDEAGGRLRAALAAMETRWREESPWLRRMCNE